MPEFYKYPRTPNLAGSTYVVITMRGLKAEQLTEDDSMSTDIVVEHERRRLRHFRTSGSEAFRHGGAVRTIAYSPDGRVLVSVSDDQTVRLWEVASGYYLAAVRVRPGVSINGVDVHGDTIARDCSDGLVRTYRIVLDPSAVEA